MARMIISSLFLASFVLSGAFAALLPDILPNILPDVLPDVLPVTKSAAKAQLWRGAGAGKGQVNGRITWWTANVNADPTLTPECKACCAAAAKEIRVSILAEIDNVASTLVAKIDETLSILLAAVWTEILGLLGGANGLIAGIVVDLENDLASAKQTCILQTANGADQSPRDIPKGAAKSQVIAVTQQGMEDFNARIAKWTSTLKDPELTLDVKECSSDARSKITAIAFKDVDEAINKSIQMVDSTEHISIGDLISILGQQQAIVATIAVQMGSSLEEAKQTCIQQHLSTIEVD
ncbi:hypothetical protein GE061_005774 [Apolygus lucorum]|uniref:Protein TsetseEP domain-containing protein n=1 Tax=Apolygus lucorum TaxID=248454 RepID=A0A8S9WZU9_APOLU|nr:hypothetical protein GE061_005774 [Apolygus lucorum]